MYSTSAKPPPFRRLLNRQPTTAVVLPAADERAVVRVRHIVAATGESYSRSPAAASEWFLFGEGGTVIPFEEGTFALTATRAPLGDPVEHSAALRAFRDLASRAGKQAVILSATDEVRTQAEALAYETSSFGSEPLVDISSSSVRGRRWQPVRSVVKAARAAGLVGHEMFPWNHVSAARRVRAIEERSNRRWPVYADLSLLGGAHSGSYRYFAASHGTHENARLEAVILFVPAKGGTYVLETLVIDPDAPVGAAEVAALAAVEGLALDGVAFLSMGIFETITRSGGPMASRFDWLRGRKPSRLRRLCRRLPASHERSVHLLCSPGPLSTRVAWEIVPIVDRFLR